MKHMKGISSEVLQIYEFSSSDYTVFSSLMLIVGDLCCIKYANQFSGNIRTTTFSPCPQFYMKFSLVYKLRTRFSVTENKANMFIHKTWYHKSNEEGFMKGNSPYK